MTDLFRRADMRIRDWRHERYIRRLKRGVLVASRKSDRVLARIYWQAMVSAINARSPAQVARMERRMGLR